MRRRRTHRATPRRVALLAAAFAAVGLALALPELASGDAISPEAGPTQNAVKTDTLYKIVFFLGLAVIALVWGILFYSLVKYRARRGRPAPQIRGNTPLELGWTIGATVLVTIIAIITFFFVDDIKNPVRSGPVELAEASGQTASLNQPAPPGGDRLNIKVAGQQYLWRYQYPNGAVSFHDMIVPKDVTVTLDITSNDVAHSWWIPKLGPKFDAIRGYTNKSWFKVTETGSFTGQCGEYCGANHAYMTARVIVLEPDRFREWAERQKRLIDQAREAGARQREEIERQAAADETDTESELPGGEPIRRGSQLRTGN